MTIINIRLHDEWITSGSALSYPDWLREKREEIELQELEIAGKLPKHHVREILKEHDEVIKALQML